MADAQFGSMLVSSLTQWIKQENTRRGSLSPSPPETLVPSWNVPLAETLFVSLDVTFSGRIPVTIPHFLLLHGFIFAKHLYLILYFILKNIYLRGRKSAPIHWFTL